jgi:hypothetical protein
MTPTPRTDAAEILWNDTGLCVVPADFARYLERELAELTEWREMIDREVGTLREELATERELADRLAIAIEQVLPAFGAGGDLSKAWDTWNKARN